MPKKRKKLRGEVKKVIRYEGEPEKVDIEVPQADELYRELRVTSEADGDTHASKPQHFDKGEQVQITIETDTDPNLRPVEIEKKESGTKK